MATISNTPRPGYAWDATDNCWYPIGTGPHTHSDYITQSTAINPAIVDAKGDLIVGSAADTVIRKPVGTDGQLLYADSTATGGIKWDAAPASGSLTLLSTTTLSGTTTTISSINQSYKSLRFVIFGVQGGATFQGLPNSSATLSNQTGGDSGSTSLLNVTSQPIRISGANVSLPTGGQNCFTIQVDNYTSTTNFKPLSWYGGGGSTNYVNYSGVFRSTSAVTSFAFNLDGDTFTAGTVLLYGVN